MKVAHIVYGMEFGGIETMLINIMNEQIKHADVTLIILNRQEETSLIRKIDKNVNIIRIDRPIGSKNPFPVFAFNWKLLVNKYDIIHIHHPGIIKFIFLKSIKKRLCLTTHDICTEDDRYYIPQYPHVFSISESVQADIAGHLAIDTPIVLNGIDCSGILPKDKPTDSPDFKIVQIGRLVHMKKGQDILIEAVSLLKQKGYGNIYVDFIGDGESKSYLQEIVKSKQLDSQIRFLGNKEQAYIFSHLKDYDLFVQPSRREGFGLTVTEAMAARVPVLVSDQEGPMEIIENGKFGYFFKSNSPESCANQIELILNGDNSPIISPAYERAVSKYNVKRTALEYIRQYKIIIG